VAVVSGRFPFEDETEVHIRVISCTDIGAFATPQLQIDIAIFDLLDQSKTFALSTIVVITYSLFIPEPDYIGVRVGHNAVVRTVEAALDISQHTRCRPPESAP